MNICARHGAMESIARPKVRFLQLSRAGDDELVDHGLQATMWGELRHAEDKNIYKCNTYT